MARLSPQVVYLVPLSSIPFVLTSSDLYIKFWWCQVLSTMTTWAHSAIYIYQWTLPVSMFFTLECLYVYVHTNVKPSVILAVTFGGKWCLGDHHLPPKCPCQHYSRLHMSMYIHMYHLYDFTQLYPYHAQSRQWQLACWKETTCTAALGALLLVGEASSSIVTCVYVVMTAASPDPAQAWQSQRYL